jgi:RHS repeat-associated protein
VNWLVTDQLGTPRMVVDKSGTLAGVKRHDYFPYGEEVPSDGSWRTTARGYAADNVRQKFTSYERDNETGLDFAQARYYASAQGRFTIVDPLNASAAPAAPQTWNRYTYGGGNPLRYTDPSGQFIVQKSPLDGLSTEGVGSDKPQQQAQAQQQSPPSAPVIPPISSQLAGSPEYQKQVAAASTTTMSYGQAISGILWFEDIGGGVHYTGGALRFILRLSNASGMPLPYFIQESAVSDSGIGTFYNPDFQYTDDNGQFVDTFGYGARRLLNAGPLPSAQTIEQGVLTSLTTPVSDVQTHTINVYVEGIGRVATMEGRRALTNENPPRSGVVRPYQGASGALVNNYRYALPKSYTVTYTPRSTPVWP